MVNLNLKWLQTLIKFLVISGFSIATTWANTLMEYRTSTGAIFYEVEYKNFGKAWSAPDGKIWSQYMGQFSNGIKWWDYQNGLVVDSAAIQACKKIGGRLPEMKDYQNLRSYFELRTDSYGVQWFSEQGKKDFYAIFPDTVDHYFWTSSVLPYRPDGAYCFGYEGNISTPAAYRSVNGSVRCVGP